MSRAEMKSLLPLLALLLIPAPALADGRQDWSGYDWKSQPFGKCIEIAANACLTHRAKWDWKRNQWVDLSYALNGTGIDIAVRLTNNDRKDDDHVCVTALFLDEAGNNVAAVHANLHSRPQSVLDHTDRLRNADYARIASVHVGTKQCRLGATQDDAVYSAVLSRFHQ
jgi:hypothetical protein